MALLGALPRTPPRAPGIWIPRLQKLITVGRVASPSVRTGPDLPHPALQLVVLPRKGPASDRMSNQRVEQPVRLDEGIWQASPASCNPLTGGRQHPLCPDPPQPPLSKPARPLRNVYPLPAAAALTPVAFRMIRSSRRHLPASLRSTGIARLQRSYGGSAPCATAMRVACSTWHITQAGEQVSPLHGCRLPDSPPPTTSLFPPSLWHRPSA